MICRNHEWVRSSRPSRTILTAKAGLLIWRWTCHECGSKLEKSDTHSVYPVAQDCIEHDVLINCSEQIIRIVTDC